MAASLWSRNPRTQCADGGLSAVGLAKILFSTLTAAVAAEGRSCERGLVSLFAFLSRYPLSFRA